MKAHRPCLSIPGPSTSAQEMSIVNPEDILPVPRIIKKSGTRRWKRTKSSIISTPNYREQLTIDDENKNKMQVTTPAKLGRKRKISATRKTSAPRCSNKSSVKKLSDDLNNQSDDELKPELNVESFLRCSFPTRRRALGSMHRILMLDTYRLRWEHWI